MVGIFFEKSLQGHPWPALKRYPYRLEVFQKTLPTNFHTSIQLLKRSFCKKLNCSVKVGLNTIGWKAEAALEVVIKCWGNNLEQNLFFRDEKAKLTWTYLQRFCESYGLALCGIVH
ncbi:hypothetical protein DS2_14349 [Catenovulum agarivorans DS-2]|uniref:Uncharacterized protein n=1 Tax=Catenovulum agarivorans DS-2 TaxID=1328313 RepID=W7QUH3_9ALTE|nr:hypothetical protein DS2_14349 [Catenovulum agarivorans DS-2]